MNENGLFNSDNIIAAPGVTNGAQHFHDYVGNQANNAFASDEDLANAETSCDDQGDKSSVLLAGPARAERHQEQRRGPARRWQDGNVGEIVEPAEAELTFVGNRSERRRRDAEGAADHHG
ncbi:membrane protein [Streptomyces purpurascens]